MTASIRPSTRQDLPANVGLLAESLEADPNHRRTTRCPTPPSARSCDARS
jgi:hypothetical protein